MQIRVEFRSTTYYGFSASSTSYALIVIVSLPLHERPYTGVAILLI